jgi:hypothetical protein
MDAYDRLPPKVREFFANSVSPPDALRVLALLKTMPVDEFLAGIRRHEISQHRADVEKGKVALVESGQFQVRPRKR